jgi:uncharacterized protein (TIGR03435 family)
VYALIVGKGGSKLHETSHHGGKPDQRQSGYTFTFTNAEMVNLVGVLSQVAGRNVLDITGLSGQYDFKLSYAPERSGASGDGSESLPGSVFTALREQLGLDLEPKEARLSLLSL